MNKVIPFAKAGEKNTKNLVIFILREKHPLSVQEIFDNLRENFEPEITYQAARKSVLSLVQQGIISKAAGSKFEIDRQWINQLDEFSIRLKMDYDPNNVFHFLDIKEGQTRIIKFKTSMIIPYYWFLEEAFQVNKTIKRKTAYVAYFYGMWPTNMVSQEQFQKLQAVFAKNTPYIIDGTTHFFSKELVKFWRKNYGGEYRMGIDLGRTEFVVFSDYILRIVDVPTTHGRFIDLMKTGHLGNLYKMVFSDNVPVIFMVTKNKKIARYIRQHCLKKYFGLNQTQADRLC